MVDIFLILTLAVAWGAQVAIPRQLAAAAGGEGYARALPLLLLVGALAGYAHYAGRPDAAVAAELVPLWHALSGRLLLVLLIPWLGTSVLAAAGGGRLGTTGWRIVMAFGGVALLVASWSTQRLEIGAGPLPSTFALLALVACRAALAMAAGELVAPRLSTVMPLLGAGALALTFLLHLLPETAAVGRALVHGGQSVTTGSGMLLFAAAAIPRLGPRLRRAALLGAVLLAAVVLTRSADISQLLGDDLTLPPMPPLPTF